MNGKKIIDNLLRREKNVITILKEMQTLAKIIIDLSFATLMTQDKELLAHLNKMNNDMDVLQYQLEIETMLAARAPKDALRLAGVNRVASAMQDIASAALEITDSLARGIPIEPAIKKALYKEGNIKVITADKDSNLIGKKPSELEGIGLVGLKRDNVWYYEDLSNLKIKQGDLLVLRGLQSALERI